LRQRYPPLRRLFRRDDGMVCLTGSKGQHRIDVRASTIRIVLKNRLSRLAGRHQAKNVRDRNAQAANTWTAMHPISIDRYPFQKVWQRQHHSSTIAPSLAFVSRGGLASASCRPDRFDAANRRGAQGVWRRGRARIDRPKRGKQTSQRGIDLIRERLKRASEIHKMKVTENKP
jgi:hypothetical protein